MIVRPEAWIIEPDAAGDGLLKAWAGHGSTEFPLPIETPGTLFSFSCLGNEYDAVYYADAGKITLKEGNIVSCVYRLHGVLRESN